MEVLLPPCSLVGLVAFGYKYGLRSDLRAPNLKKFSGGAWPQTPLACACVCTHHHRCPPNLKYLPPPLLVSQARPTSAREGKGLVNCVYKPCPAAPCSAVQSHCSILSHDALRHCLCTNSSLENGEREVGHLFR